MSTRPRKYHPVLAFILILFTAPHIWVWGTPGKLITVFVVTLASALLVIIMLARAAGYVIRERNRTRGL